MTSVWLRLVLGLVLLFAGLSKFGQPNEMAELIAGYRVLPLAWLNPLAVVIPVLELVLGAALVTGFLTESAALVSAGIFAVFALAVGSAAARGIDTACGCFTTSSAGTRVSWGHALLDIVLMALAISLLRLGPGWMALDQILLARGEQPQADE